MIFLNNFLTFFFPSLSASDSVRVSGCCVVFALRINVVFASVVCFCFLLSSYTYEREVEYEVRFFRFMAPLLHYCVYFHFFPLGVPLLFEILFTPLVKILSHYTL